MSRPSRLPPRGSSLIELMIAMAVMAVGLLAMWHLHVLGITSNAAGRRHTVATAVARELVTGLERLAFSDTTFLSASCYGQGSMSGTSGLPGCVFGPLVDGSGAVQTGANVHVWNDSGQAVPGVRLDSQMREQAGGTVYERRWTVWDLVSPQPGAAGSTAGVKLIAVSVIWRDPPFTRPREVVLYAQVANAASIVSGLVNSP